MSTTKIQEANKSILQYEHFDVSKKDFPDSNPNASFVFPADTREVTVIIKDKDGYSVEHQLKVDESGTRWVIQKYNALPDLTKDGNVRIKVICREETEDIPEIQLDKKYLAVTKDFQTVTLFSSMAGDPVSKPVAVISLKTLLGYFAIDRNKASLFAPYVSPDEYDIYYQGPNDKYIVFEEY